MKDVEEVMKRASIQKIDIVAENDLNDLHIVNLNQQRIEKIYKDEKKSVKK